MIKYHIKTVNNISIRGSLNVSKEEFFEFCMRYNLFVIDICEGGNMSFYNLCLNKFWVYVVNRFLEGQSLGQTFYSYIVNLDTKNKDLGICFLFYTDKGFSLSDVVYKYIKVFSYFDFLVLHYAELKGDYVKAIYSILDYLEMKKTIKFKLNLLLIPIILTLLCFIYLGFGSVGYFIVALAMISGIILLSINKKMFSLFIFSVPVISDFFKNYYSLLFFESLYYLVNHGVPIGESFRCAGMETDNYFYSFIGQDISQRFLQGENLNSLFDKYVQYLDFGFHIPYLFDKDNSFIKGIKNTSNLAFSLVNILYLKVSLIL